MRTSGIGYTKPTSGARLNYTHPLARGIIGAWMFLEGGGIVTKDLASGNYANLNTGVNWSGGKNGKALHFDGSSGFLFVNAADDTNSSILLGAGNKSYALETLVKPITTNTDGCVIAFGAASLSHAVSINADVSGNVYSVHFSNDHAFAQPWLLNQWNHVIISYDAGQALETLYFNGQLSETWAPSALNIVNKDTYHIGKASWTTALIGEAFIEYIRIYNRPILPTEAMQLYLEPYSMIL